MYKNFTVKSCPGLIYDIKANSTGSTNSRTHRVIGVNYFRLWELTLKPKVEIEIMMRCCMPPSPPRGGLPCSKNTMLYRAKITAVSAVAKFSVFGS